MKSLWMHSTPPSHPPLEWFNHPTFIHQCPVFYAGVRGGAPLSSSPGSISRSVYAGRWLRQCRYAAGKTEEGCVCVVGVGEVHNI